MEKHYKNTMDERSKNEDHDLLIRLDENVKGLITEIKGLRSDTISRIEKIENDKADKQELRDLNVAVLALIGKEETSRKESDKDIETRMRAVERFVYIAIGVVTIAELVLLPLILKLFKL